MARRWLFLSVFVFLNIGTTEAQAQPMSGNPRQLRFGTFLPAPTINVRFGFKPWIERVNRALAGRLRIELFAGGAMGRNGHAQLRLIETGVLDIALLLPHYTPGQFPDAGLFEFPLHGADALEVSLVFWRMYERGLLKGFDRIHPLALYVATPSYLHLAFPYHGIDDLRGRKIRVTTLLQARVIEDLGGTPVGGISATQIAESLSRGLLDGAVFNWFAARRPMGITRVTNYHLERPVAFTPGIIAMNKQVYLDLPADVRVILDGLSGEPLGRRMVAVMREHAARTRAQSRRDPGRHFVAVSAPEEARWHAAFDRRIEDWRRRSPRAPALLAAYGELLAELRATPRKGSGR